LGEFLAINDLLWAVVDHFGLRISQCEEDQKRKIGRTVYRDAQAPRRDAGAWVSTHR
jgi:hypothetical protein